MAELALAIASVAGTVDVCIKLGKYLVQAYKDYGQVDRLAEEVSVRIQVCWIRIASQLEIIKELESGMTDDQRELQSHILRILQSKLEAATVVISKPDKHGISKRYRALHFLNLRESLERTVADLESWQKRFEPSWFQILKTGPASIDNVLKSVNQSNTQGREEPAREGLKFRESFNNSETVKLAEKVLENLEIQAIPYCEAEIAVKQKDNKYFIIDTVSRDTVALRDARELASRLRDSNPSTFGTLKCKGVVQLTREPSLKFIFGVPDGYSRVRNCRELLLSGIAPESLTTRLNIARQLVTAVYYVHLYEFVHKNITPETMLTLECRNRGNEQMLVCLVGFQLFRYADAPTNTSKTEKRSLLYQHPTRIDGKTVKFVMQHDIYSLGVCLLEIGLWRSLVEYDGASTRLSPVFTNAEGCLSELDPQVIKDQLILLSRTQLRICMGDIYSTVVETCLTCLDVGNTAFGDPQDFDDQEEIEVGSRFVKRIMNSMNSLCF
ncbi:uncharacterized protein FFB20_08472 [Fusarium fujikuroi]|nr:uncharacterized protein FFB20_08472 [Fusarium fujikuroi]SCO16213.1 uncharacterized protein FFC1_12770 [Fusarium fujikuroi]SCO20914.1 uncharacterized protein FFE2_14766 [Fusarium fujikuroi]SCO51225.1 uncharacterized protein FFNC_13693 [Fusarium fujikuroi]SCV59842.1 uncharacterized protein FFFS_14411 [Fusarium fujikuroi]